MFCIKQPTVDLLGHPYVVRDLQVVTTLKNRMAEPFIAARYMQLSALRFFHVRYTSFAPDRRRALALQLGVNHVSLGLLLFLQLGRPVKVDVCSFLSKISELKSVVGPHPVVKWV